MLKGTLKTKSSGEVNRSFKKLLSTFNLLILIEKMKYRLTLLNGNLHSMVLLNKSCKQEAWGIRTLISLIIKYYKTKTLWTTMCS